jgi:3-oxoadipate enol-lactonase
VVVGAEDQLTPLKYSALLRDRIPGEGFLVVPGAGHMVTLEAPEAVVREAVSLLAGTS